MGTKPWVGSHFGGAVKPNTSECEEAQQCPLPEIELEQTESINNGCKNGATSVSVGMKNIGPNNILPDTTLNLEWVGLPENITFSVSGNDFSISEDGTILIANNLFIVSDNNYARHINFLLSKSDCDGPFLGFTCTITTDDYTLLNEGNQFVITYTS